MNSPGPDLSVPCLRCSQDSAPHGEHHLEHKGSGGRGPKAPATAHERVPLCRGCHNAHHAGDFDFTKKGLWYVGTKGGDFRSPVTYDNESEDRRFWEVDKLTAEWHEVDEAVVDCYKVQCQEAYAIKDRIGWMPEWWIEAAKQFAKDKRPVHWSAVYDRVASWETFELRLGGESAWDAVLLLGEKGRRAVCAHANPQWALDVAIVARLAGDTVARVVKLLKVGEVSDEPKTETCEEHEWRCRRCGVEKGD